MAPHVVYAPTSDGWRLALCHWEPDPRAAARVERKRHPVLMVHGLGANRINLDLDERYSVARAVARRGFDVFVLELRGAGLSRAPHGMDRSRFQWGFGDYAERDLPAAISAILERTGAAQLHGMGHSMGGMLLYAFGTRRPPELRSITAVGSPFIRELRLAPRELRLLRLATQLAPAPLSDRVGRVPIRKLVGAAGRFAPLSSKLVDGILLNADNTEPAVVGRMAREGIDDVPLQLLRELTAQMTAPSDVGPYAYEAELHRIDVPVLAIGGGHDRIAPLPSVEAAVDRLASRDVRYRPMGRRHGDQSDYGHIDLLVGRNAPEEVFPQIVDFLEEVD